MRHSLQLKFLAGYLLFVFAGFLFVATIGSHLVDNYVKQAASNSMLRCCQLIGNEYQTASFAVDDTVIQNYLQPLTQAFGYEFWVIGPDGTIRVSTNEDHTGAVDFNPTAWSSAYLADAFPSLLESGTISVFQVFLNNNTPSIHVIAHCPPEQLWTAKEEILRNSYITLLILTLISLLFVGTFHLIVSRPLRKITRAAREYAAGNLAYESHISSKDEMGDLSNSLTYMAKRISSMNEDQKRFVANVSHDFRSPLTSIKGYIEAIQDGTIPPAMQDKYLGIVLDETDRLNKLTQSLLTLNTFDDKGIYLDRTNFDVNFIIKKILATFEQRCQEKKITFDLTFASREQFIYADMGKIQQVLYNLIDNAIKFSNPDSSIQITSHIHHEKLFLSVKDHGVGIPKENLHKVWDRFYKTDTSRGKDKKGTGLGLSIVREIIKAHGENIDIVSTPGVGSEFILSLPLAERANEEKGVL